MRPRKIPVAAAAMIFLFLPTGASADASDVQAEALGRIITGDETLKAKPLVRVAVIAGENEIREALALQGALSRQGFGSLLVPLSEPEKVEGNDVYYFSSSYPPQLAELAKKNKALTIVRDSSVVEAGLASIALVLKEGKPELTAHLGRILDEGHSFGDEALTGVHVFGRVEAPKAPEKSAEPEPDKPKNAPPYVLEQSLITRVEPKFPAAVLNAYRGKDVESVVLVCVAKDGSVDRPKTRILKAVAGTEAALLEAVLRWKYKPQPISVCAPVRFVINVK
ncbi:MAG: hypothetical protein HY791_10910 [Deltaproteobacteria bacterium]|nr:hypothetical protein [Deltaproteobacteria bacterium]